MRINTNLTAMNTFSQYSNNTNKVSSAVEKLSSGYAINSAADNAAGLAISEKMRAQIRGLDQASANSQDAISLVQTAESALSSSTEILQRMREIAVQSASDTNNDTVDRDALQDEFAQLQAELNENASDTSFNTKNLLDGSLATSSSKLGATSTIDLTNIKSISVGQSSAGTYTMNITATAAVAASTTAGTVATVTDTEAAGAAATLGFTGTVTDAYNGNTYTLAVDGSDVSAMTFSLVDSNNNTVSSTTVDCSSWSAAGAYDVDFSDYGTLTVTAAAAGDLASASSIATVAGSTLAFSAGVNEVTTDAQAASLKIEINGEAVTLKAGDTTAVFKDQGISFSFDALSDTEVAAGTIFGADGSTIVVGNQKGNSLTIQTGANSGDELEINISGASADALGVSLINVSDQESASTAIDVVDNAINSVSSQRAYLGAIQNRLDYKIDNLDTSSENLTTAESQIRDVDMASEMTNFTNANILLQASTAMLAQANSLPQNVLSLIG